MLTALSALIVASTASYLRDHCVAELANSPLSSVLRKRFGAEKLAVRIRSFCEESASCSHLAASGRY